MAGKVYAYPDVGRAGLGNLLFPWARAEVFAQRYGTAILAPQWTKPKMGPLLRGERDKRFYVGLFDSSGFVRGPRRWMALWRGQRVDESVADQFMSGDDRRGTTLVVFKGFEFWFKGMGPHQDLMPHRELVTRRLHEIVSTPLKRTLAEQPVDFAIAAHVRRGDKPTMNFMEPYGGLKDGLPQHHCTMSDQWFVNAINNLRAAIGWPAPLKVFSDARDEQIQSILALENVTRAPDNPSIVDLLMLAKAKVLITTGTSSFSAWASFVGGAPTIWYPGLRLELTPEHPERAIEADLAGELPADAAPVLRAAVGEGKSKK
jgi:hypothetical protein